jgi:CRP-like cAMP-binding protein
LDVLDYRGGGRAYLQLFLQKLQSRDALSADEIEALFAVSNELRVVAAQENLAIEGARTEGISLVLRGMAIRYKLLSDGRRQIVGYCLPGDLCDVRVTQFEHMDHSVCALGPVHIALLSRVGLQDVMARFPRVARAIWCSTLLDESIAREWIVNMGYRSAYERLGHLLCELYVRMERVGFARDHRCEFPFRQSELADMLALSTVHVNRTLMEMRRQRLISVVNRQLIIHDMVQLEAIAGFNARYLQLQDASAGALPSPIPAAVG